MGVDAAAMKKFAEITAKYIGKPFSEYSCMGFLHAIYSDLGVEVPDEWEGLTLDNYMDFFESNPLLIQSKLMRLCRKLGKDSRKDIPRIGDLLVVAQDKRKIGIKTPGLFPAIYGGKNTAIASFVRSGVCAFQLDANHRPVVARRMV